MAEYKSNQCPDCGCGQFEQKHIRRVLISFETVKGDYGEPLNYFGLPYNFAEHKHGKLRCENCRNPINESESIKQGKIVLMD